MKKKYVLIILWSILLIGASFALGQTKLFEPAAKGILGGIKPYLVTPVPLYKFERTISELSEPLTFPSGQKLATAYGTGIAAATERPLPEPRVKRKWS